MFGKQKRADPFAQYWAHEHVEQAREGREEEQQQDQQERDYVSPFRNEQEVASAQQRRTQRFPTTSAGSAYAHARPEELGYRKIGAEEKRAKDIPFPVYLEEVEKKQHELLRELEGKEAHLRYLKESQVITEAEPEPEAPASKVGEETPVAVDEHAGPVKPIEEAAEVAEPETADVAGPEADKVVDESAVTTGFAEPEPLGAVTEKPDIVEPETHDAVTEVPAETKEVAELEAPVETPIEAPAEIAAPVEATAPIEIAAPVETSAPIEIAAPVETTAPVEATTPIEIAAPVETTPLIETTAPEETAPEAIAPVETTAPAETPAEVPAEDHVEAKDVAGTEAADEIPAENVKKEKSSKSKKTAKKTREVETDPLKVPMVSIPAAPRPFLHKIFKSAPHPVPNPVATPENPEHVVKTKDGYVTKAIYDKIRSQNQEHNEWIAKYKQDEQQKYDDKRAESNRKANAIRGQIKEIKDQMAQLRKDTDAKIEVSENGMTRKFLQLTQVHIQDKNQVFKDTDLIKSQKISEKDVVLDKQSEVQKEIDQLNVEKEQVEAECQKWSKDVEDLSARIDAKVADLAEINTKQKNTQEEIDNLQQQKVDILDQIEKDNLTHSDNEKVIEGAKNKTYLPRLHEIDTQISVLLGQLTTIRHHCTNERTELSAITKKLDQERLEHEEKLKLEAENRKRKEENLLSKQRQELEDKAREAREQHETEMQKLRADYDQLEDKFKQEQQQKKDVLASAHKPTKDDSLFEYGTEEEILTV